MTHLNDLIHRGASSADIATFLDDLPPQHRVRSCLSVRPQLLGSLFDRVRNQFTLDVDDFIAPPRATVVYELRSSAPVLNIAQRWFFRPTTGASVGFNHTGAWHRWMGPGYFFVHHGDDGELVFDYTRQPALRPPGWPPILPNFGLVAGSIYGNQLDYVRRVSATTVVGTRYWGGKPRRSYFLLTRSAAQS